MSKRAALIWLWMVGSFFFTAIFIPKQDINNWKEWLVIFALVATTIEAIYITVKQ